MEIKPVTSESFRLYGRIINEYDYDEMLKKLEELTDMPGVWFHRKELYLFSPLLENTKKAA